MTIVTLRSEYDGALIGVAGKTPLLSWVVASAPVGTAQNGYRLQASDSYEFARIAAEISSVSGDSQFIAAPGGELNSREVRWYRVAVEFDDGLTVWSNPVSVEAGLLAAQDWVAQSITDGSATNSAPTLFRSEFELANQAVKARVYATAHGNFELVINGRRVGEEYFAPGWTTYQKRLLVATYDVTELLSVGVNTIGAVLSDGWWRGKFGFLNMYDNYGTSTDLLVQLEIEFADGSRTVIGSSSDWHTSTGEIRKASIYDGTTTDFNQAQPGWAEIGFDASAWAMALPGQIDFATLAPRVAAPVVVIAELPASHVDRIGDRIKIDLEQNISGWLRFKARVSAGTTITIRHAELREHGDILHTKALRGAAAIDTFVFAEDGVIDFEPSLTFHGFQYADVFIESGEFDLLSAVGVAISSRNAVRGEFKSNHQLLNKLVSNTFWSLRDNFVSLPTDCPQRDERLGWTGDAQAFAYAAHTLVDDYQFFKSWLIDLGLEQQSNGIVPVIVPDLLTIQWKGESPFGSDGTTGWGDAATVIPFSMYQRFGDLEILRQQIDSMQRWVDYLHTLILEDHLFKPEGMQLGDWLDPDAPEGAPWAAKVSGRFVATAYTVHSTRILVESLRLLGRGDETAKYEALAEQIRAALWVHLAPEAVQFPTGAALALEFDLAPSAERAQVADGLAQYVRDHEGRIATGFLGTPVVLDALSSSGHWQEAYLMLLRTGIRSWLYPITMGATTIWERWEAILEDGTIAGGKLDNNAEGSDDSMISFNHYAYGAVVDWIYRNVGGITAAEPGYRRVLLAPMPHEGLTSCATAIETGYGRVSLRWHIDANTSQIIAEAEVPFGVTAELGGALAGSTAGRQLAHGIHQITAAY
jgi:alpha-L-rhamnosidase